MNDFKINIEKRTPITVDHFIELGWILRSSEIYVRDATYGAKVFQKDNHCIIFYPGNSLYTIPFIKTMTIDPSKENWTPWPEDCRSMLKCPTKEILEIIQHII